MKSKTGPGERITARFVRSLCSRLREGKPARRNLPFHGRIHIDRQLPFLCVHRYARKRAGEGADRLITGEPSYLLAPGRTALREDVAHLVRGVAETMSAVFGAFLILEVWEADDFGDEVAGTPYRPAFRIVGPKGDLHSTTHELAGALGQIRVKGTLAHVEVVHARRIAPPRMSVLVGESKSEPPLLRLGIAIRPIYRDAATGQAFPLIRRQLHRGISRAIKKCVLEFTRCHTTHRPPHFHSLGRRSMVKAVWEVDRQLAAVSDEFDFLLLVTPTNAREAWRKFERDRCAKEPKFLYRPLPIDPALSKRRLFQVPVERVEDPTLELLFRAQQAELDRKLTMLGDRNTERFKYQSLQLYGAVSPTLRELALEILRRIPARSREASRGGSLSAHEFAARATLEIEHYRASLPELSSRVEVRDDVVGLMVSRGNLLVGSATQIPLSRVDALLSHEIGTHVLTYFNGRAQPFRQLYVGLPGYDELQEGLAVLAEHLVGGLSRPRLRLLAARVLAVDDMIQGASFVDGFRKLVDGHGFSRQTAFSITMRVFRSGGFGKDAVYLRGLVDLLAYLGSGGAFAPLLIGKLGADHVGMVEELQWRHVLRPAPLRPRYLDSPLAVDEFPRLRQGKSVIDLIQRSPK